VTKAIFVFVSRSDQDPPAPTPLTKDPRSQSSRRRLARRRMCILRYADNDPSGRLRPCRMPRNIPRRRFLGRGPDENRWCRERLIATAPDAWRFATRRDRRHHPRGKSTRTPPDAWRLAPGRSWPDAGRDRMLDMRRRTTRGDWMGRLHPGVDREDVGKKPTHAVFSCLELTLQGTPRL
jgi:hypothetical protein